MKRFSGLLLLYGSRLAGVAVSVFFIPVYARLLGPADFGLVALLLSAQALVIMLDLGMAALTSRDLASDDDGARRLMRWKRAESLLTRSFAAIGLVVLAAAMLVGEHAGLLLASMMLFWAVTLQNLAQAAMVACGDVQRAALIQGVGVLLRGALCVATLTWVEASLRGFILSQLLGALAHLAVNRHLGQRGLPASADEVPEPLGRLAQRGLPLFLVGLAGAAVLQMDKLLVGGLISPAAVAPYFLATTFCMTPIAILAAPVAQLMQPRIVRAHALGDAPLLLLRSQQLVGGLAAMVVLPTALLWLLRQPLIDWWLHDPAMARDVAAMSAILLPAAAIGAVGNVPLALLNALGDFAFQARLSALLTVLTLGGVGLAAARGELRWVCWIYLAYYAALTASLWWRAATQGPTSDAGRRTAVLVMGAAAALALPLGWLESRP